MAAPLQGLKDGIVAANQHRWFVAGLGVLLFVIMFGYSATGIILPMVSADVAGDDSLLTLGVSAYSVGGILAPVLVARWEPKAHGW